MVVARNARWTDERVYGETARETTDAAGSPLIGDINGSVPMTGLSTVRELSRVSNIRSKMWENPIPPSGEIPLNKLLLQKHIKFNLLANYVTRMIHNPKQIVIYGRSKNGICSIITGDTEYREYREFTDERII